MRSCVTSTYWLNSAYSAFLCDSAVNSLPYSPPRRSARRETQRRFLRNATPFPPKTLDACRSRCYFTDRSVGYPQIKILYSFRNFSAELWGRAEFVRTPD